MIHIVYKHRHNSCLALPSPANTTARLTEPLVVSFRSPAADILLEHPSSSRQHAAVCYRQSTTQWVVLDLNSAHGTFVNGQRLQKVVDTAGHVDDSHACSLLDDPPMEE